MNITFLIGNGFDIGLGLKTQYEKFYDYYQKPLEDDSDNIKDFKKVLKKWQSDKNTAVIDWADFESAFGKHSADFKIDQKREYLERFEDFVVNFNAYVEDEENRIDYSNSKEIGMKMRDGVLKYYINRKDDKEAIEKIYRIHSGARTYNFISFNYTNTVDRCADLLKQTLKGDSSRGVGSVLHIHGYVERNMIIGVDNPSQISNPEFENDPDVVAEIVKPNQNVNSRENYENDVIPLINSSHIICVYGMSLGDTDKKWWNLVSKWLSKDSNRALIIMKYDKNYYDRFIFNFRKFDNSIRDRFLSFSDLPDDIKAQISKRIYVGMNNNVFEMKLCEEESTLEEFNTNMPNSLVNV